MNFSALNKNQISDFQIIKSNQRNHLKTTISTGKQQEQNQKHVDNCPCVRAFQQDTNPNQFECQNCEDNLQKVAELKKINIVVQFNNAKLHEQNQQLRKQNSHLKKKLSQKIEQMLKQNTGSIKYLTIKEDLESELFQCKLINQLMLIGQYPKGNQQLKQKLQESLIEKLTMQQKIEQMSRIINDTVLYPIYHYDSRIKTLKDTVAFLHKNAIKQCKKSHEQIKKLKLEVQSIKKLVKAEVNLCLADAFNKIQKEESIKNHQVITQKQNINVIQNLEPNQKSNIVQGKFLTMTKLKKSKRTEEKSATGKSTKVSKHKENHKESNTPKIMKVESRNQKFMRPCCV